MCGIFGFLVKDRGLSENEFKRLTDYLHHRGPDGEGYFQKTVSNKMIGLAHKRLSILDLSDAAYQPMTFENLTMVYNGEVYNFQEIRTELISMGYIFNSTGDTEVVLKSLHCWGMDALLKFSGMFAIALFDNNSNKLYLVRDRVGVKPLFYWINEKSIVFGSELRPIMDFPGFKKEINKQSLDAYLSHGYITSPHSIFTNTHKLQPGHFLTVDIISGEAINRCYYSYRNSYSENCKKLILDEKKLDRELSKHLENAVAQRLISDVPVGIFLSGGYDSSIVTYYAQRASELPVDTFTIGFHEEKYNEAQYAKNIAKHIGTNHHEFYLSINEGKDILYNLAKYYDEPFADTSSIATLFVSNFAKNHVKVVLTGDGGDELFCGYNRYDQTADYQKYIWISNLIKSINSNLQIKRFFRAIEKTKFYYLSKIQFINSASNIANADYLLTRSMYPSIIRGYDFGILDSYFKIDKNEARNPLEEHMIIDFEHYLPDDIMAKIDRATMHYSIEGREPLLDKNLIEFSARIPLKYKYKDGIKKYVLKKHAHSLIPESLLNRPKKGFSVPVLSWILDDLDFIKSEFFNIKFLEDQSIFDASEIYALFRQIRKSRINLIDNLFIRLLIFQIWYKEYLG